jgi:integrase
VPRIKLGGAGWLDHLERAPKTKANIKSLLGLLIEAAMFPEYLNINRNPMELVTIKGCTRRQEEPRILTVEEFQTLLGAVNREPLRTMLLFDVCTGLRFSELIGLQWCDFDWKNLKVTFAAAS